MVPNWTWLAVRVLDGSSSSGHCGGSIAPGCDGRAGACHDVGNLVMFEVACVGAA